LDDRTWDRRTPCRHGVEQRVYDQLQRGLVPGFYSSLDLRLDVRTNRVEQNGENGAVQIGNLQRTPLFVRGAEDRARRDDLVVVLGHLNVLTQDLSDLCAGPQGSIERRRPAVDVGRFRRTVLVQTRQSSQG